MAALLVEKNPQMPPCCCSGGITGRKNPLMPPCRVRMAALLVEKNSQMPPWCTNGGITGRKKSANAALLLWRRYYW
jgi:hypothetical protein